MRLLGGVLERGGAVNDLLSMGIGSFYTTDNVGCQGLPFHLRQSTPAVTGAFGDLYVDLVIGLRTILIFSSNLRRSSHSITFLSKGYHKERASVNLAYCTNLGAYIYIPRGILSLDNIYT